MIVQTIKVNDCAPQTIVIGRRGTYDTMQIAFDLSYLVESYGNGVAVLAVKRSQDESAYPAVTSQEDDLLLWTVSETDTYYVGAGEAQLMWYVDGGLAKTIIYPMVVMKDILMTSEEAPDAYQTWVDDLTALGAETLQNAQNAAQSASDAEQAKDDAVAAKEAAEAALEEFTTPTASATTLAAGSQATAAYADGNFSFGIPRGADGSPGAPGAPGADGVTPDFSIGTVTTLEPTQPATATITGTSENPVLNLGIPKGAKGDPGQGGGSVDSVNGQTGDVVLDAGDLAFSDSGAYDDGTVGAELSSQKNAISELDDTKAPVIINTASGDIATFADGADGMPIKHLIANIEPVQAEGTPSPTNILPITGRTGLVLSHGADASDVDTISVSWATEAGTVYGGTLDVITGVLTVDMIIKSDTWGNFTSETSVGDFVRRQISISDRQGDYSNRERTISNIAPFVSSINDNSVHVSMASSGNYLYAILPSTVSQDQVITIAYPVVTPQTYQLDPVTVNTLLGNNTVYVDCGSVSVDYPADTGIVVKEQSNAISQNEEAVADTQSMIATVEATTTASKNYSVGDLLVYDGKLYKVTSAIATGATIIVGSNVAQTTVESQIAAAGGGGGGGGSEKTWKKFRDVTVTLDKPTTNVTYVEGTDGITQFSFSVDDNGNSFEYTDIKILAIVKNVTGQAMMSVYSGARSSNISIMTFRGSSTQGQARVYELESVLVDGVRFYSGIYGTQYATTITQLAPNQIVSDPAFGGNYNNFLNGFVNSTTLFNTVNMITVSFDTTTVEGRFIFFGK